jgi:dolichyl-phosphate beta-glucosyltransferase
MKRVIVVPCFNEARRLDVDKILMLEDDDTEIIFVDDGSSDGTRALLDRFDADVLALDKNSGKGEAVRVGMLKAIERDADVVAYLDADLSAPPEEMERLLDILLEQSDVDVVLGSRVRLLGRDIARKATRHYLGRVFGTAASLLLDAPVYDTQCGAKAFRVTPTLRAALAERFVSRWAFDVELLGRLRFGTQGATPVPLSAFVEVPLTTWRDANGSKLGPVGMAKAGFDLVKIALSVRK